MVSTALIDVLVGARALLARSENDFAWSSWTDQAAALGEIDQLIAEVQRGQIAKMTLDVLVAPTGPMQEVSLSSGWAREFLTIAERYDKAIGRSLRG